MSLWFRRTDEDGKTHYYTVPFEPLVVIAVIAILIAVLLSAIQPVIQWLSG